MERIDSDIVEDMHRWRRDLHANPEMAFAEKRTSALVAKELAGLGLRVDQGLAGTGVVATLCCGGAYIWLGAGDGRHSVPLHNPLYDFNDAILEIGARYWVRLIQQALPPHEPCALAIAAVERRTA